jgi:hypothetical protein
MGVKLGGGPIAGGFDVEEVTKKEDDFFPGVACGGAFSEEGGFADGCKGGGCCATTTG